MIQALPIQDLATYTACFSDPHLALVLASVAAGNTAAQLWAAQTSGPALLLWDKGNNVFYFAGEQFDTANVQAFAELIATQIRPSSLAERSPYFKARALMPGGETVLPLLFAGVALHELPYVLYSFERPHATPVAAPDLEQLHFVPIDRALLESKPLAHVEQVRGEIRWMWGAEQCFYERGFGYAALAHEQVICWCTAEYVSAARCGVGIETVASFQRRGVATATAAHFVQQCLERSVTPFWECRADNLGSRRVAEKLGFSRIAAERYWMGRFET